MADQSTPLWERSKENAAPLERGRRVSVLEQSLAADGDRRYEQQHLIQHYERLVRPSEDRLVEGHVRQPLLDDDDDPLVHWLSYIKFHQETFPSDTHEEFLLLERCLRALSAVPRYADDPRFIRVCCLYAEKTNRASEIFNYLYAQKIGANVALFWVAWAFVAEKEENFAFADKILEKGIRKQAQPLNYLLQRQKQFQRRMSRYWLNASRRADDAADEADQNAPRREIFGGLTDDGIRRNDRAHPSRTAQARSNLATFTDRRASRAYRETTSDISNQPVKNTSFAIFVEQGAESENEFPIVESPSSGEHFRKLERDQDRKKENTVNAERWNERGALSSAYSNQAPTQRILPPPAFSIHVDKDCAAKLEHDDIYRRRQAAHHRHVRDDRTFREREDGGPAEKLANDPLRYVRNPSQLAADESKTKDRTTPRDETQEKIRGFNQRLMKSATGGEQSFEEARLKANYFTLAPATNNFSRFSASATSDNDGSLMSMDEEESLDLASMDDIDEPDGHMHTEESKRGGLVHKYLGRTDSSFGTETPHNTSMASSTIDEPSGTMGGKEEPTINTQWALRELSMMFSSPALAASNEGPTNRCAPTLNESRENTEAGDDTASIDELVSGLQGGETSTFTSIEDMLGGIQSVHPPTFDSKNAQPCLNPQACKDNALGFQCMAIRTIHDGDVGRISKQPGCLGNSRAVFGVQAQYQDLRQGVRLGEDGDFFVYDENQGKAAGGERDNSSARQGSTQHKHEDKSSGQLTLSGSFQMFRDEVSGIAEHDNNDYCGRSGPFPLHQKRHAEYLTAGGDAEGDTASFSLLGDVIEALNDINLQSPEDSHQIGSMGASVKHNATINYGQRLGLGANLPTTEDETTYFFSSTLAKAFDYTKQHREDVKTAADRMKTSATGSLQSRMTLVENLLREHLVCYLPTHPLPKVLRVQTCLEGAVLKLDHSSSVVKKELGRGAYGVVLLLVNDDNDARLAVKAQSPVGSLAWEYEILSKIDNRINAGVNSEPGPFPRALSFVSLADGALLSMTACSTSGFNLVDLVNIYTQIGEHVPEIISLHYAARMLRHLEQLHWKGKILHCDVKPDNWVLRQSTSLFGEPMEASDLSLVDFGRSIDLTMLSDGNDAMNVMLLGDACPDAMMSVPMRTGLPWSFDIDTFGLCASAHVLVFGSHMNVGTTPGGRWMPQNTFHQSPGSAIWIELFDTLLNVDEVTKAAIGSRPHSLRRMRMQIEDYLLREQSALRTALKHQMKILSSQHII